jgi:hypothetical protein
MKLLLILWTTILNALEGAVWATLLWTATETFFHIPWIYLFWVCFVILYLSGLQVLGADPLVARLIVATDPKLVGLSILMSAICALIPTVLTVVIANMVSPWTHVSPGWLHVFLFFACGLYIIYRWGKGNREVVQMCKRESKPEAGANGRPLRQEEKKR